MFCKPVDIQWVFPSERVKMDPLFWYIATLNIHRYSPALRRRKAVVFVQHSHLWRRKVVFAAHLVPVQELPTRPLYLLIDLCHGRYSCSAKLSLIKHMNKTHHWKEQTMFSKCTNFQSHRPKCREVPSFWKL